MAFWDVKVKEKPEPKNKVVKEERVKCKVAQVSLGKNRIDVLLQFPSGKTAVSSIESEDFMDNVHWVEGEPYAYVSVQMMEINVETYTVNALYASSGDIRPEERTYILDKPKYKILIKINDLYLTTNPINH